MQTRFVRPFALVCILLVANAAHAQDDGGSWWDFSPKEKSTTQEDFFGRSKPMFSSEMFKLPKMPWSSSDASKPRKSGPSMLSKMGQSTKRMWNSTVDFMNPFNNGPAPARTHGYQPQNTQKKSGGGPFGWMWREETTETPATVNDWLRQPNPLMSDNGAF